MKSTDTLYSASQYAFIAHLHPYVKYVSGNRYLCLEETSQLIWNIVVPIFQFIIHNIHFDHR